MFLIICVISIVVVFITIIYDGIGAKKLCIQYKKELNDAGFIEGKEYLIETSYGQYIFTPMGITSLGVEYMLIDQKTGNSAKKLLNNIKSLTDEIIKISEL